MAYVFYDTETTGLSPAFDQIVQFAAVRASDQLQPVAALNLNCKLQPHVLPSPEALCITNSSIEDLISPERPSFFEMMRSIRSTLLSWSPSVFIGYNSIRFDESFLRFGFYQTLHPAYLTSRHGNARGDALSLVRAVHALRPDVIQAGMDGVGNKSFKLRNVCEANGFKPSLSHEAKADVDSLIWLCRRVSEEAPEIWSQFLRFTNRSSVDHFLRNEEAVILVAPRREGNSLHALTWLGASKKDPNLHFCLKLSEDVEKLCHLRRDELHALISSESNPIRRIRINASPLLLNSFEADDLESMPSESEILEQANVVRRVPGLTDLLLELAYQTEKAYPTSPHVENQLYENFVEPDDERIMATFHQSDWIGRTELISKFSDDRIRRLGLRVIFFESPSTLKQEICDRFSVAIRERHRGSDHSVPWMTISKANMEISKILLSNSDHHDLLSAYKDYLARL